MLGQVQDAASDAVEHTIQASAAANRHVDRVDNRAHQHVPAPPLFSTQQGSSTLNQGTGSMAPPIASQAQRQPTTWDGFSSQGSSNQPRTNASTHRQPLQPTNHQATPRPFATNFQSNSVTGTPMLHKRQSPRTALGNISGNGSAFAGYGMSAGLKVSNQMGTHNNIGRPQVRSRGLLPIARCRYVLTRHLKSLTVRRLPYLEVAMLHSVHHQVPTCSPIAALAFTRLKPWMSRYLL
jgi:E3 ubiquitin-protein ligase CCNP1IP1